MVTSASYPMFHYDVQRAGNVSGDTPMTDQRSWSTYIGGLVDSSPIISDGKVFVSTSVKWLKGQQNDGDGFGWVPGEKSDYDDTAAAIEALIAAGESPDSKVIRDALEYLKTSQNDEGGFKYF